MGRIEVFNLESTPPTVEPIGRAVPNASELDLSINSIKSEGSKAPTTAPRNHRTFEDIGLMVGKRPLLTEARERQLFLDLNDARTQALKTLRNLLLSIRHENPLSTVTPSLIAQNPKKVIDIIISNDFQSCSCPYIPKAESQTILAGVASLKSALERCAIIRSEIAEANLRYVARYSKRYLNSGFNWSDLFQMGIPGLLRAIAKFDLSQGCRFTTYLTWWLRQSIETQLSVQKGHIRVPRYLHEKIAKLRSEETSTNSSVDECPTPLAELTHKNIAPLVVAARQALSKPMHIDQHDDNGKSLADTIQDQSKSPTCEVECRDELLSLNIALRTLSKREVDILKLRFGIGNGGEPLTLKEIGEKLKITSERVRQLQERALCKLRSIIVK